MSSGAIKRLLLPLRRKIFLLMGKAMLSAISADDEKTQRVDLRLLGGEVPEDLERVERYEPYGFETKPLEGAEALATFLNGHRGHGVVLVIHDRRTRPQNLSDGDTMLYTHKNEVTDGDSGKGHRIWMKADDESIQIDCTDEVAFYRLSQTITALVGREIETPTTTHKGNYVIEGNLEVRGGDITCHDGDIMAPQGDVSDHTRSMQGDRDIFNVHQHPENFLGITSFSAPPTDAPIQRQ